MSILTEGISFFFCKNGGKMYLFCSKREFEKVPETYVKPEGSRYSYVTVTIGEIFYFKF